jgi:hypothetical protein
MPSVEVTTAAAMAAVSWLEGVARTASGSVALRRVGFGPWRVHEPAEVGAGWRVVAWWPPLTLAVLLEPDASRVADATCGSARLAHRLRARQRRARVHVALLRVLGALVLLTLVAGIPLATARLGVAGLVLGVAALLYLGICTSVATYAGLRRAGVVWRAALLPALRALWPFLALRAAATVQGSVVAGAPPAIVTRVLLGEPAFARWVRPALWDATHRDATCRGVAPEDDAPTLVAEVAAALVDEGGHDALAAARAPDDAAPGDAWCPRCARLYRASLAECAACDGVALVGAGAGA